MKLGFILFFLLVFVNFHGNFCKKKQHRVSLFGSHFMSSNSSYKVFLVTNGLDPGSKVTVEVGHDEVPKTIDFTEDTSSFHELDFGIPAANLAISTLKMTASNQTDCKEQSTDIIKTSESPMIFIQFNKPIYKSGDEFKFRIFVLNQKLLPYLDHGQMDIIINDQKSYTVRQFKNSQINEFGEFNGTLGVLRDDMNPGIWTISVNVGERFVTKSFEVHKLTKSVTKKAYEYHMDAPELIVDSNSVVAFVDRKFYLTIYRKDQNIRKATVTLEAKFVNSTRPEIHRKNLEAALTDAKTVVMYDFQNDFGIKYPAMDMNLLFTVSVTNTRRLTTSVKRNVLMKHRGRNTIQIARKKYFKPEFKFPIKVRVKILDGKADNSLNQLNVNIKYESKDKTNKTKITFEEQNFQSHLKNGEIVYTLHPKADTEKIHINAEFADTEYSETIERHKGPKQYMQVTALTKSYNVGTTVQFLARTTGEMEHLYLIVFGSEGIIKTANFAEAIGRDEFEFSLELTDEMKPEARGIVFFVQPETGHIVYDEFSLQIGFSISNWLEISANETAKPNDDIMLNITTENGSNVYLVAIDANSGLFNGENEVTRSSIYEKLTYFINRKLPSLTQYQFDKFNGFFMEPLTYGAACAININSRFGTTIDDDETDDNDNNNRNGRARKQPSQNGDNDDGPSGYFPEILFDHFYQSSSNETQTITIDKKFPDSATTWKIYGISIHPTMGFTVAKTQPEITVNVVKKSESITLDIDAPLLIKQDEIHQARIIVTNVPISTQKKDVLVSINNGYFVDLKTYSSCIKPTYKSLQQYKIPFTPDDHMIELVIYFSSKNLNPIEITAKLNADLKEVKVNKKINVEASVESKQKAIISYHLTESQISLRKLDVKEDRSYAYIYGNLLGPTLNGLESVYERKMHSDEEKMMKFAASLINYKYLAFIDKTDHDKSIQAKDEIADGCNTAKELLKKNLNNNFRIWFVSFITGLLIDAENLCGQNIDLIYQGLNHIRNSSFTNGTFSYDSIYDNRKDISSAFRKEIQTALIIGVFLKNDTFKIGYVNEIRNSMIYLNNSRKNLKGDHANSIVGYTFALNNDTKTAKEIINDEIIKHGYKTPIKPPLKKHLSMHVEVLSYLILGKILIGEDPKDQVEWLFKHRNANGAIYSPFHTVLSMQALYEYTKYKSSKLEKLVKFEVNQQSHEVENLQSVMFQVNKNSNLMIHNQGLGYVNIIKESSEPSEITKLSTLSASTKIGSNGDLEIKIDHTFNVADAAQNINFMCLETEIPYGYKYSGAYEQRNNGSIIVSCWPNLQKEKLYFAKFNVVKQSDSSFFKPLTIKYYDYYRPNMVDRQTYEIQCRN